MICSYDEYIKKMEKLKNESNTINMYPENMSLEIKQEQMQAEEGQVFFVL